MAQLGQNKTLIHEQPVILKGVRQTETDYDGKKTTDDVHVEVVLQYNDTLFLPLALELTLKCLLSVIKH